MKKQFVVIKHVENGDCICKSVIKKGFQVKIEYR